MKKLLSLGLFAAACLATPAPAHAWGTPTPVKVDGGVKIYLNVNLGAANLPLAPWYLYYPAEARFQPAGPPVAFYPNWPQQPPGPALGEPPPRIPEPLPPPGPGQPVQRTGYRVLSYQNAQVPAYWYGE